MPHVTKYQGTFLRLDYPKWPWASGTPTCWPCAPGRSFSVNWAESGQVPVRSRQLFVRLPNSQWSCRVIMDLCAPVEWTMRPNSRKLHALGGWKFTIQTVLNAKWQWNTSMIGSQLRVIDSQCDECRFKGAWLVKDSTFIYNDHDCSCLNEELPKGSGFTVFERHSLGLVLPRSAV